MRLRCVGVVSSVIAAVMVGVSGQFAVLSGQEASRGGVVTPSRTADGKPNLQGIWQVRNRAWGDLEDHEAKPGLIASKGKPFPMTLGIPAGRTVVEGGPIPYQPWANAKRKEYFAGRFTLDPLTRCYLLGVPRISYLPLSFQIYQTPKYIAIRYEYAHAYRIIYMDGSKHPEGITFWMGDSRGRWEGDTLVVEVKNFAEEMWLDMSGNFVSPAATVVERYTLAADNTLQYEVTIDDPKVFTRQWKLSMPIHRQDVRDYGDRLLEYECVALAEEDAGTFVPGRISENQ